MDTNYYLEKLYQDIVHRWSCLSPTHIFKKVRVAVWLHAPACRKAACLENIQTDRKT